MATRGIIGWTADSKAYMVAEFSHDGQPDGIGFEVLEVLKSLNINRSTKSPRTSFRNAMDITGAKLSSHIQNFNAEYAYIIDFKKQVLELYYSIYSEDEGNSLLSNIGTFPFRKINETDIETLKERMATLFDRYENMEM
jgi:hypothetical protein